MGLLIGGVSGYLIGHAGPSTSSFRADFLVKVTSLVLSNNDLATDSLKTRNNFSWEQSDIEQLQFLTGTDVVPEEMVDAMERLPLINLDNGELKYSGMITLYNKEVKATLL